MLSRERKIREISCRGIRPLDSYIEKAQICAHFIGQFMSLDASNRCVWNLPFVTYEKEQVVTVVGGIALLWQISPCHMQEWYPWINAVTNEDNSCAIGRANSRKYLMPAWQQSFYVCQNLLSSALLPLASIFQSSLMMLISSLPLLRVASEILALLGRRVKEGRKETRVTLVQGDAGVSEVVR